MLFSALERNSDLLVVIFFYHSLLGPEIMRSPPCCEPSQSAVCSTAVMLLQDLHAKLQPYCQYPWLSVESLIPEPS